MAWFLDTNIFLRHLTMSDPQKAAACTQLLLDVAEGRIEAWTSDVAIAEVVFVLSATSANGYGLPRTAIRDGLLPLLALPGLYLPSKRYYPRIFQLYTSINIDFVDAFHVALLESSPEPRLYSYDRGFDRIGTLIRQEPSGK